MASEQADFQTGASSGGGGGGSTPGEPVYRKFPFTFDMVGIANAAGHTLYTPNVGDILVDGWIEVTEAFDGTTPVGDFGTFTQGGIGWLANAWNFGADMSVVDSPQNTTEGLNQGNSASSLATQSAVLSASLGLHVDPDTGAISNTGAAFGARHAPARFTRADPIKVVVAATVAQKDGTPTGATQGAGILYLVTVAPV